MRRDGLIPKTLAFAACLVAMTSTHGARDERLPFEREIEARAADDTRPTVVVFKASWCPVCREMERGAFRSEELLALSDELRFVEIDIDRQLSVARAWKVDAVPQIVLLDAEGNERRRLVGGRSAAELGTTLRAFLANPDEGSAREANSAASKLQWAPRGYRAAGLCFSHVGYGPLHVYAQSPLQALRMGILPRTPSTLARGQWQVRGGASWVNVWAEEEGSHELDYEMLQLTTAVAYGLSDKLELEVELSDRSRFGGGMDGFVQGFHDAFGVGQNGRDEVPRDRFHMAFTPEGQAAVTLDDGDRGSFSRSVQVSLQHNITCGTERLPAIAYSVTARYELLERDQPTGGDELDLGVSVSLAQRFGQVYVYASLGYARFGREAFRGIALDDDQLTFMVAGEWHFAPRHALLLNLTQSEGVARDFGAFSKSSTEVTLGWKWEFLPRTTLELGLIENILSFDNSPDFGLHLGLSRRF